MTTAAKCLLEAKYAETAQTTQYTAPPNTRTIIDKATVANDTGAAATLDVHVVASGGSAGASNLITATLSIAAGTSESIAALIGHVLNPGDFVSTAAGTASALVIRISGRETTPAAG